MRHARFLTVTLLVLGAAATRLLPHPPNFTAVGAMALFGGARFADRRLAHGVPLAAMLLSDLALGYAPSPWVYAAFVLVVAVGQLIREHRSALAVGSAALGGSAVFFVVTNLGVWLAGGLYPWTAEGLLLCYVAAIPFYASTLAGDLLFSAVLFGGFSLLERKVPALAPAGRG